VVPVPTHPREQVIPANSRFANQPCRRSFVRAPHRSLRPFVAHGPKFKTQRLGSFGHRTTSSFKTAGRIQSAMPISPSLWRARLVLCQRIVPPSSLCFPVLPPHSDYPTEKHSYSRLRQIKRNPAEARRRQRVTLNSFGQLGSFAAFPRMPGQRGHPASEGPP